MRQNEVVRCTVRYIGAIAILFYAGFILSMVQAAETLEPSTQSGKLRILHHEPLQFHFALDSEESVESRSEQSKRSDEGSFEILTFDAFGQHFELLLESNDRLIANLPQNQKERLQRNLRMYRGTISGNDDSWVRITRDGDGNQISGMIWDGNEIYIIDSANNVEAALHRKQNLHQSYPLIYRLSDTEWDHALCAVDPSARPLNDYSGLVEELKELAEALPQASSQLDVAIVADTQFVSNNTNPDAAVVARMNVVDGIYSEQVGVQLSVTEIRTLSSNGALSSTNPGTLLNQFGNFSNSSGFNNPGIAHLFTGRNLDGSIIGIAYLSSLCSSRFGVGISQTGGNGTAGALTVAHEIGHNFGAPHDNQSGSTCASTPGNFIMNPRLNGSDQFSQCSLQQIQPVIQNAACITDIDVSPQADIRVGFAQNPINTTIDQTFDYKVEVRNTGAATAIDVAAQISIPSGLTAETTEVDAGACTIGNSEITCDLADISAGGLKTINITLQAAQPGSFMSTVNVSAANDQNPNNNQAEAIIQVQDSDTNGLFESHFDTGSEGFNYTDDAFRNTNQPAHASGNFTSNGGFSGGGLRVLLGGRNNTDIVNMSGGWARTFNLDSAVEATLSFRFRLTQARDYESDEFSEALVSIDNVLIRQGSIDYLARIRGDGNGGPNQTTGWRLVSIPLGQLSAGTHTIVIGAFNNKKTFRNEATEVLIDDVGVRVSSTLETN